MAPIIFMTFDKIIKFSICVTILITFHNWSQISVISLYVYIYIISKVFISYTRCQRLMFLS